MMFQTSILERLIIFFLLGLQLCDDVRHDTPIDPQVLHNLQMIYTRHGRHQEVTAMYLAAAAANSEDHFLQEAVFSCYVT